MRPEERQLAERELSARAHPAPRSRLAVALGAATVLVILVGFAVKLASPRPAHVPLGIAGLTLGSSLAEAKQRVPELGAPELSVKTALFEQPATCKLRFEPSDELSSIDCALAPGSPEQMAKRRGVLATLRALYGKESLSAFEPGVERWVWQNPSARLILEARGDETRLVNELVAK